MRAQSFLRKLAIRLLAGWVAFLAYSRMITRKSLVSG